MASPSSNRGFALVITPTGRAMAFTRYLLKNTSLPVVVTGGDRFRNKEWALAEISDIEGAWSRFHHVVGDVSQEQYAMYLKHYLKTNFPAQPLRLMFQFQRKKKLDLGEGYYLKEATSESISEQYLETVVGQELLMKYFHGFLPSNKSAPLEVLETDKCKLPAHAIWATSLSRTASISQNTKNLRFEAHASSAASLQLTKTFDNFLRMRSGEKAISVAFYPGINESKPLNSDPYIKSELSGEEIAEKIMKILTTMPPDQARGRFWDCNGEEIVP